MIFGKRAFAAALAVLLVACARGGAGGNDADGPAVRERNVTFETSDGVVLEGRLFGSGRVGVTLAHMYPADARSWYPAAQRLARAGYMAMAFNFRGYGGSEGTREIAKAPIDIDAAKRDIIRRGARDVVFVGASMGGTASIVAAESQDPLAVVAISAPTRFRGLDAPTAAIDVQRPVLLIASQGDQEAFSSLQDLERALPNPDTKVYEGDAHGTNLLDDRPEALDEIIAFLRRYAPLSRTQTTTEES